MMDRRNSFAPRRDPFPAMGHGYAADPGNRMGRGGAEPESGRFLALEPEDYDGDAVPIADPPAPEPRGAERGEEENPAGGMSCGGGPLEGYPLAMVYGPDQAWRELYEEEEALTNGTLFRELNFPFCPGCRKSGR